MREVAESSWTYNCFSTNMDEFLVYGQWAISERYQLSFVKFARKHVYIILSLLAEMAAWW